MSGGAICVLGAIIDSKPALVATVTEDLPARGVRADWLIREVAKVLGGGGGGNATFAEGGGGDPDKLNEALGIVEKLVFDRLGIS